MSYRKKTKLIINPLSDETFSDSSSKEFQGYRSSGDKFKQAIMGMFVLGTSLGVVTAVVLMTTKVNNDNNHVSAGNLNVGFKLVDYRGTRLNDKGLLEEFVTIDSSNEESAVDLVINENSVFNVENAIPTMHHQATFEVSNLGRVAFTYQISISDVNIVGDAAKALSEQILISISANDFETVSFSLKDYNEKESVAKFNELLVDEKAIFAVDATFIENSTLNNLAQNASLDFDIKLKATQKV